MPKKRGKSKQRKRPIILLLILPIIILAPLLAWYVSYGLANKPIVDYTFGVAEIRRTYRLIAHSVDTNHPGSIEIFNVYVRNRGHTNITIIITVHAMNAFVSSSYDGPYNERASSALEVPAGSVYHFVTFYLWLKTQVPSFTLSCQASKLIDYTKFPSMVASTFGQIEPVSPILLQYSQESTNSYDYQLVQQS